jgi:acetyltransferase-like isoleucine patch superfamily enzyme
MWRNIHQRVETIVESGASIGHGSTILGGLRIGSGAVIGAGAAVTRDVLPNSIASGVPAQIIPGARRCSKQLLLLGERVNAVSP